MKLNFTCACMFTLPLCYSADTWPDIERILLASVKSGYEYVLQAAVLILKRRNLVKWQVSNLNVFTLTILFFTKSKCYGLYQFGNVARIRQ